MYYRIFSLLLLAGITAVNAQQRQVLTKDDYARAEHLLSYNTSKYIDHGNVRPNWISNDSFWFRDLTAKGSDFILVDAARGSRKAAFDQQKLAAALSKASGENYDADNLPFRSFSYEQDGSAIRFAVEGKLWLYNLKTFSCEPYQQTLEGVAINNGHKYVSKAISVTSGGYPSTDRNIVPSPDGKLFAYIKDDNLWVENRETKQQTQLTTDGEKDFGYATDNAGWTGSDKPILSWSPDSKKIATFKQDQRKVSNMYLVTTNVGAPKLVSWKYAFPGDSNIIMIHRVIINVDTPKVIFLKIPPDPHRATLSDDIASSGTFDDVDWSPDGSQLAFVSTSRYHKHEKVRIANANTGDVREIFEEDVPTQYESGWGAINWRYLPKTNEFIWFSERDNWGHLYLYDATTGKVKNKITSGDWLVSQLMKVDEKNRVIYFMAHGLEKGNPYFAQFCRIDFDGKNFKILTPEIGNHSISFSPAKDYFIDDYSQPNVPGITVLRDMKGRLITTIAKTDISRLIATGWKAPTPFSVKAHDGKTDIYGLMFTPSDLDPNKKYPVIDYIYPGPQGGSVGSWSFIASRGDDQSLAELGFIVVEIEGTSNPLRSKSFHDMSYGDMAENTLPDQVSGILQLAKRYAYMDTSRVGIWGHSGGGFATADAMFTYPDFFKVGIAESGNHDNRNYEDDWGDRYNGPISDQTYNEQANETKAKNLKGKLLLAHGLMDNNVPPQNTLLVVQALERANKDYDLIIFPNEHHGYGQFSYYMMRRRWDYFVKNLMRAEPPKEFLLQPKYEFR
ncbi:DPP IV N-terminal domain-containing protein [Arachidicoccus sp.]|uniref:S9 family peptidase n=1 Tax=Arachidicoccus sp. TaxID=1872624 RepID=UPI003D1976FE